MQSWLLFPGYCESAVSKSIHNSGIHKKTFRSHFVKLYFKRAYNFNESVNIQADKIDPVIVSHQSSLNTQFLPSKTLHRALNKINHLHTHEGTYLTHGGLRIGNFVDDETLVYVRARFINQKENNTTLHSDFFKSLAQTETRTTFHPSIGFEWKLPDRLSVTGELSSDFGQVSTSLQNSNQTNQKVLFAVRYLFDTHPEIDH